MPPILEYAPPRNLIAALRKSLLAIAGFFIAVLNLSFTVCMCGYQDFHSVPGNLLGFSVAIVAFFHPGKWLLSRGLAILALVTSSVILFLNAHNILWSGHNPLLH